MNSSDTAKVKRSCSEGQMKIPLKCMPQTSSDNGNIPVLYEIVVAEHDDDNSF